MEPAAGLRSSGAVLPQALLQDDGAEQLAIGGHGVLCDERGGTLLSALPNVVEIVANVGITGLALWMMVGHHAHKLAVVTGVSERCMELQTQARSLWLSLGQLTDIQARERLDHLDSELDRVKSKPAASGVPDDDVLNQTCTEETYEVVRHQYAA